MNYRLPYLKIISGMTNITTAVMLITFFMPTIILCSLRRIFDLQFSPKVFDFGKKKRDEILYRLSG